MNRNTFPVLVLSLLLLSACMTPAEELAYDRDICRFDSGTFTELVPGDGAFEICMDLQYSGIGPDDDPDFSSVVSFQLLDD